MVDLRVQGTATAAPTGELSYKSADADRLGVLTEKPWVQRLIELGLVYEVNYALADTPATLPTSYAAAQPQINVDFPLGIVGVPLFFEVVFRATGAAGASLHAAVSSTKVGAGTSTAVTPLNYFVGSTNTPASSARISYSGNGTDPTTNALWLSNFYSGVDVDAGTGSPVVRWEAGAQGRAPLVTGGGSFNVWVYNPTSGTAFGHLLFAELPSKAFS